jgi:hypothetical protein
LVEILLGSGVDVRHVTFTASFCIFCPSDAWLVKLKISKPEETNKLMDLAAYEKHCADSAH